LLIGAIELLLVGRREEAVLVLPGIALLLSARDVLALDEGRMGRIPELTEAEAADGCID
jgi:hypothetical protein